MDSELFFSYNISHIFDRGLSTMFQPRFLARPRAALFFARVMVVPPSPIAPLETLGILVSTVDGLSRWMLYAALICFLVAGLKR